MVKTSELKMMLEEGKGEYSLGSVLNRKAMPFLHPDQSLDTALRYVDAWPIVPVISRADFRKLEGVITQQGVLDRYRVFEGNGNS